jgi:hypothetical protein
VGTGALSRAVPTTFNAAAILVGTAPEACAQSQHPSGANSPFEDVADGA